MNFSLTLNQKRIIFIVTTIFVVSLAHYFTSAELWYYHSIYQKLYYVSIFAASFWFGLKGGMLTALAVSVLYLPHIIFQWGGLRIYNLSRFLELGLYNIIGFITGYLSNRQIEERKRYQKAAEQLDILYSKLKTQTQQLVVAEEGMRQADRLSAIGELSASMAHEIRNPLGSIKGTVQILGDKIRPEDKEYEFLQILSKEIDRLNRVVSKYLNFAKPEQSELAEENVNEVLNSAVSLIKPQLKKLKIVFLEELSLDLPPIAVNSAQLEQVFLNLLMNAIQAMPCGGNLIVMTKNKDRHIFCSIRDTGKGITEEQGKNIFNPFFTTKKDGTGLGLFIVRKIIISYGGHIEWESKPGKGTKFMVWFPKREQKRKV